MKPWLWVLVACSPEHVGDPAPPPAPVTIRQSVDILTTGAPVEIRGVEVTPQSGGGLQISYRAEASGHALVPARTMCRVGERNVAYPISATGMVPGPRLTSIYRADPFTEPPAACEITFLYAPDELTAWRAAGHACWTADTLREGACPDTTFPPPVLATAGAVVLERTALELHDSSAVVTALFTLTQAVSDDRRFAAALRCEDATGVITAEAALTFVPLAELGVGASMFGPVTFALERTPAVDARCTLDIVSRTVTSAPGGDRIHAQYCLTTRSVSVGRCMLARP